MKTTPPLTDAEINELDELLAAVPAPYETVDAVILDGYLAGVLVQPVQLEPEQWLSPVFGTEGMPEPGFYEPVERGLEIKIAQKLRDLRERLGHGRFVEHLRASPGLDPRGPVRQLGAKSGQPGGGTAGVAFLGHYLSGIGFGPIFFATDHVVTPSVLWRELLWNNQPL